MLASGKYGSVIRSLVCVGAAAVLWLSDGAASSASAQTTHSTRQMSTGQPDAARSGQRGRNTSAGKYFVEFRSRYALSYGHTFVVHGRLNARGETGPIRASQVAGLHPAGADPGPWMAGHLVFVRSETGASDGDTEDQYVSARYRIVMNEAEYRSVSAYIRQLQGSSPLWHAVFYNCNAFAGDIAKFMGLRAPAPGLMPPEYINQMRSLNAGRDSVVSIGALQVVQ
jgi:hypothetical protein